MKYLAKQDYEFHPLFTIKFYESQGFNKLLSYSLFFIKYAKEILKSIN